jgi:hypothetical protein
MDNDEKQAAERCRLCRRIGTKTDDGMYCYDCYQKSLEKVYLTFHGGSKFTSFEPRTAVFMIDKVLNEGMTLVTLAMCIDMDHSTDDRSKERRYQELILSKGQFVDKTTHAITTKADKISVDYRRLRGKRKKYTEDYVKGINVEELEAFTAPISDEHKGGFNYGWKELLKHVRPYWKYKAEIAEKVMHVIGDINLTPEEQDVIKKWCQAVCKHVQSYPREFDLSNPCAFCHEPGHAFKDCPILKNCDYLVKHHTAFCLQMNELKHIKDECTANVSTIDTDTVSDTNRPIDETTFGNTTSFPTDVTFDLDFDTIVAV